MDNHTWALEQIEHAEVSEPFCRSCGQPTSAAARDGEIRLECISLNDRKPLFRRILTMQFGHTNRLIIADPIAA